MRVSKGHLRALLSPWAQWSNCLRFFFLKRFPDLFYQHNAHTVFYSCLGAYWKLIYQWGLSNGEENQPTLTYLRSNKFRKNWPPELWKKAGKQLKFADDHPMELIWWFKLMIFCICIFPHGNKKFLEVTPNYPWVGHFHIFVNLRGG